MQFIYKISFANTHKVYIGKSCQPLTRWGRHKHEANVGNNAHLYKAMRKYGIENAVFEVIVTCLEDTKDCANHCEKLLIEQYDSFNNGYNMTPGGDGPGIGAEHHNYGKHWKLSPSTKAKMSKAQKGKNNPMYGKKISAAGQKLRTDACSHIWKIYRTDNRIDTIKNLTKWAKNNNYSQGCLHMVFTGKYPKHKDVIKVEKIIGE